MSIEWPWTLVVPGIVVGGVIASLWIASRDRAEEKSLGEGRSVIDFCRDTDRWFAAPGPFCGYCGRDLKVRVEITRRWDPVYGTPTPEVSYYAWCRWHGPWEDAMAHDTPQYRLYTAKARPHRAPTGTFEWPPRP